MANRETNKLAVYGQTKLSLLLNRLLDFIVFATAADVRLLSQLEIKAHFYPHTNGLSLSVCVQSAFYYLLSEIFVFVMLLEFFLHVCYCCGFFFSVEKSLQRNGLLTTELLCCFTKQMMLQKYSPISKIIAMRFQKLAWYKRTFCIFFCVLLSDLPILVFVSCMIIPFPFPFERLENKKKTNHRICNEKTKNPSHMPIPFNALE